jgi:CHAT domain-containing protein
MRVRELLKDDELDRMDPGSEKPEAPAEPAASASPAAPDIPPLFSGTPDEAPYLAWRAQAGSVAEAAREYAGLLEIRGERDLTDSERARMRELEPAVQSARDSFSAFVEGLSGLLAASDADRAVTAGLLESRQETLAMSGSGSALVYVITAPETLYLVLATPHAIVYKTVNVAEVEVDKAAEEFKRALKDPASDPRPSGGRLYDLLIRPLEPDITGSKAERLAVSLDGALRYVPVAAFWDGTKFLAESYPTSVLTRSSVDKLRDPPPEGPAEIRALATSVARDPFPALPGAAREIETILRGSGGGGGEGGEAAASGGDAVLPGRGYLDDAFTLDALSDSLASKAQAVHIASHFRLAPGNLALSELLLGDGSTLTLSAIKSLASLDFKGLDILTLSACDTASGEVRGDGAEVEGFGEIVQNRGAAAVLASLWPVDDASTAFLMREFYRLRYTEGMGKSEALRGAQTAVMHAGPEGTGGTGGTDVTDVTEGPENRGAAISALAATGAAEAGASGAGTGNPSPPSRWDGSGWSHPYYWAPFVLMGNWR